MIRRILNYLETNYSNDISLKTLAIELNTNANYLGQLFKEETGEYFSDYLNMIRINKAKELLRNTDKNTKDISNDVGYKDVNYFYRTFKKFIGVPPSEYRSI
ncbi:MAG: HTH-type transcriptional regulator YesS [Firmicutes bacterium ADurb.Bin419]|nr:MAG: HTH-type transcriptional regulator YesS [Firmicutes bacterium ADurb.Bin419]